MAEMKISNTLWNDTSVGEIAFAEQLKDKLIDWTNQLLKYNGSYPNPDYDPEDPDSPPTIPYIPDSFKTEDNKFQSNLNTFFLNHWADFQKFLHEEGVDPQTIDSWKEVQDFLKGLPDDETMWLMNKLTALDTAIAGIDQDGIGVFDISAYNNVEGTYAEYVDFDTAILAVPSEAQKPGMSVRYIDAESHKYKQYRLLISSWSTDIQDWQGIDEVATEDSINLVQSGGVYDELSKKANYDGYYSGMTVGSAEGLIGSTVSSGQFLYRQTNGGIPVAAGFSKIEGVKGSTVVWNHLIDFREGSSKWIKSGNVSDVWNNGVLEISQGNGVGAYLYQEFEQKLNHKYLYIADIVCVEGANDCPAIVLLATKQAYNKDIPTTRTKMSDIIVSTVSDVNKFELRLNGTDTSITCYSLRFFDLTLMFGSGNEPSTVEEFEAWLAQNVGLKDYYPYNAGELIPVKMTGLKTVGFNQWDEEWELGAIRGTDGTNQSNDNAFRSKNYIPVFPDTAYYLNVGGSSITSGIQVRYYDVDKKYIGASDKNGNTNGANDIRVMPSNAHYIRFNTVVGSYSGGNVYRHDICINLSDTTKNGTYEPYWTDEASLPVTTLTGKLNGEGESVVVFPDGMKRADSVYDEIKVENGVMKAIKRVGSVDLGTFSWYYNQVAQTGLFYAQIPLKGTGIKGIACSRLSIKTTNSAFPNADSYADNSIGQENTNKYVYVKYTSTTDTTTFQTAMSGVYLFYELATPEEYILDADPVTMKVDPAGTEQVLPENTTDIVTCAPTLDIVYPFDMGSKEDKGNKVTSLSSESTDEQYPSAKTVYDSVKAVSDTVERTGVYDVTANNSGATFASLSALLSDANLEALIPVAVRKGGMTIRFVNSSDNKYVQYFLTKNTWSTNIADWEKMNLEEEISQLGQKVGDFEVGTGEGQYPPLFEQINGGEAIIETPVQLTLDTFYNTADAIQRIGTQSESVGSASVLLNVIPGEKYNIHGASSSKAARLYCFADSEKNYTFRSEDMNTRVLGLEITIPNGTAYMVCNFPNYNNQTDGLVKIGEIQIEGLAQKVQDHEERIADLEEQEITIADNLTTDDPDVALSARQGKIIGDILNGGEEETKTPQTPLSTSGFINCAAAEIGQAFNRTIVGSYEGYACWRIPVSIGEKYEIQAKGNGDAGALYVLTGNNDIVLAKVGDSESKTTPVILNITQNGFLYVNDLEYSTSPGNVYKVTTQYNDGLIEKVEELEEHEVEVVDNLTTSDATKALSAKQGVVLDGRLTDIENEINGTPTTETITYAPQGIGSYINSGNTSVGDTFNKTPSSGSTQGYMNYKVPVQRGDVVSIYGYGNGAIAKLYVLTNSQNIIVAMVGNKNTHTTPEVLNIEADGWVYVNDLDYSVEVGKVVIQRAAYTESLEDRMKEYTDEQVASAGGLYGKNILIFGDSMSTATDATNKTYIDYVAEKTGAIIKNIAVGGTRFAQRYEPTLTPDTNTAYANLDICNMVYAVCENDFSYADAAVTALNRYGNIISLAKTIVPDDIDIIILEGGGNDYLNGHNLGVTDSIDKNTTLGALNYMIQKLSTTFPKAKIIGESNQVLYSNPPAFSATKSYVVDDIVIYNPGSGYLRYKFINNHSGAWDSNDAVEINNVEWRKPEFWSDNDERIGGLTFRELIAEFEKRFNFYHIPYANMYETMGWNEYNFSSHYPDTDNHHPNDMKSWGEHLIGYLEKL